MSLFSDIKALYDAINASPRNWSDVFNAFVKVLSHFFSDQPATFGSDAEAVDAKSMAESVLAKCNEPPTFGADGVGTNGEKILELIKLVLPLIIKWL